MHRDTLKVRIVRLLPGSLASRVFLLYAVVLTLFLGLGMGLFYFYQFSQKLEDVQDTAQAIATVTAQAIQESVVIGDYDAVGKTLTQSLRNMAFQQAEFIDLQGGRVKRQRKSAAKGESGGESEPWPAVVTFSVADTGIGIAEAAKDKLFAMFSQADASTTRRFAAPALVSPFRSGSSRGWEAALALRVGTAGAAPFGFQCRLSGYPMSPLKVRNYALSMACA